MIYSELIGKLVSGKPLSAVEQQQIVLKARDLEQMEALFHDLLKPGTRTLKIDGLETRDAKIKNANIDTANITNSDITTANIDNAFITNATITQPYWNQESPLHTLIIQRLADTTISNATDTYVTPDTTDNFGTAWSVSGNKVYWTDLDNVAFNISGYVIWAANATGYRGLWVEGFDASDVSLGTAPLHTFAGNNLVDNVCPVSFTFKFNGFSYVKFFVHQTSGGDLTMKEFTLGLSLA